MDFDPLSFFEPDTNVEATEELNEPMAEAQIDKTEIHTLDLENTENSIEVQDDDFILLQVMDLPQPNGKLTYPIIKTVLKMFQPDQVKNFGNVSPPVSTLSSEEELTSFLNQKSLTMADIELLSVFMNHDIKSVMTISHLPKTSSSSTTSYLTKVISYPFETFTEDERDEIYDLASYVMTASSAPAMKGNTTRLVEIAGLEKEILLYEPALTEDKVGNITWGASLELAKQIVNKNTYDWLNDSDSRILELGAGTGLVTIVLGFMGYRVMSTDLPEIVDNLEKNVSLNKLECSKSQSSAVINDCSQIHSTSLDWRSPDEFLSRSNCPDGYQTVILSDPVYSPQHPYWVQDTVRAVLSKDPKSRLVYMIGRRDRFQDVRDNLWNLMKELGLKELQSEIVKGFDDYGILEYDYKVFGWEV